MPQPTQGLVVAEPIPPRIDIKLPPTPIVITEQAVVFSTAAAVPLQPTRWWTAATRAVGLALRMVGQCARRRPRPQRVFFAYPPRLDFLDSSRTEREMHRL
jgi:hypothetical protein